MPLDIPADRPAGNPREAICRGCTDAFGLPEAVRIAIELGLGHLAEVPDPCADQKI